MPVKEYCKVKNNESAGSFVILILNVVISMLNLCKELLVKLLKAIHRLTKQPEKQIENNYYLNSQF